MIVKLRKLFLFLKFPKLYLHKIMRNKIISNASDLFLNYGFKSVTMDDIASAIGISKKTIYQHFSNKTELVEATTMSLFKSISEGIDQICALENCPIEEIYDIKQFVMRHLKDEKSSPQYQLQKYYPQICSTLKNKQYDVMHSCVTKNLQRGVSLELYRDTINIEFITRIYFTGMTTIKDKDLFPNQLFSMKMLMENYLEYHLRGICTEKGIKKLNSIIKQKTL